METRTLRTVFLYYGAFGIVVLIYYFLFRWQSINFQHNPDLAGPGTAAFLTIGFFIVSLMLISKISNSKNESRLEKAA